MAALECRDVSFKYRNDWVVRNLSFRVARGDFFGILGPNGSGKTTLLRLIDGILPPERGSVRIGETDITMMKRSDIARIVAMVPQDSPMIFPFTVGEVVLMGRAPHLGRLMFERDTDHAVSHRALALTDTLSLAERTMDELSGGERQRVLVARALAQEPGIVLLDESTAFLDIRHQVALFELMGELNRTEGLTVIAVTHDINLAALFCDRIMLLKEGRMHSIGTPDEVITASHIREVYETEVMVDDNPQTGSPRVTLVATRPSDQGNRSKAGAAPQL